MKTWDRWKYNEASLRRQWSKSLQEKEPNLVLDGLRDVRRRLQEHPTAFSHLYVPFLQDFFCPDLLHMLTVSDLKTAKAMGDVLVECQYAKCNPAEVWFRVVQAHVIRGETSQAQTLLIHMYRSLVTSSDVKQQAVLGLINMISLDDEHLTIYLDYLQHEPDPNVRMQIYNLLAKIYLVDFEASLERLRHARKLVVQFASGGVELPKQQVVLGLYALQAEHDFSQAIRYFRQGLHTDSSDSLTQLGLLTALLRQNDYQAAASAVWQMPQVNDVIVIALKNLCLILHWLDTPENCDAFPVASQSLVDIDLSNYVGETFNIALGRLHLLEGNAQRALQILYHFAGELSQQQRWTYYCVWASILCGDRQNAGKCFKSIRGLTGDWAVACLLLETDPAILDESEILSILQHIPLAYMPVFEARVALARSSPPPVVTLEIGHGTLEMQMETLRTILGVCFYRRNETEMKRMLEIPLFYRLPLADQLTWRGLYALLIGNKTQANNLLKEAGIRYRYPRAILLLTVYRLEQDQTSVIEALLSKPVTGCSYTRIEQLRSYLSIYLEDGEEIKEKVEQCSYFASAKGQYTLGRLYLRWAQNAHKQGMQGQDRAQHYREQATKCLTSAVQMDTQTLPADSNLLVRCAVFIANPTQEAANCRSLWHEVEKLDTAYQQPWFMWYALLALLWSSEPPLMVIACEKLLSLLEQVNTLEDGVALALARLIARTYSRAEEMSQKQKMLDLLRLLASRCKDQAVKRLYQQIVFFVALLHSSEDGGGGVLNQHLAELLCYQAVQEYKTGNVMRAAKYIRQAVAVARRGYRGEQSNAQVRGISVQKLEQFSHRLELHIATQTLIRSCISSGVEICYTPGRYYFLERVIEQHAPLLSALLNNDGSLIQQQWQSALALSSSQPDVCFLHGLAVIFHESALAKSALLESTSSLWQLNIALWMLLLSAREFWNYFAQTRVNPDNGELRPLDTEKQDILLKAALQRILPMHSTAASQAFAAGDYVETGKHIRCLDLCRKEEAAFVSLLHEYHINYVLHTDKTKIELIKSYAGQVFMDWCDKLLQEAEQILNDAEAIEKLPNGIRKNYEGAIRHLENFLHLDVDEIRVLRTCLVWYNDWCYDATAVLTTDDAFFVSLVQKASKIAARLVPLCRKGREFEHKPENQTLASHFSYQALASDNIRQAITLCDEAISWESCNIDTVECHKLALEIDNIRHTIQERIALSPWPRAVVIDFYKQRFEQRGFNPQVAEILGNTSMQGHLGVSLFVLGCLFSSASSSQTSLQSASNVGDTEYVQPAQVKARRGEFHEAETDLESQQEKTHLSLYDPKFLTEDALESFQDQSAPRPEIHSPDQSEGDVASVPLFPNPPTDPYPPADLQQRLLEDRIIFIGTSIDDNVANRVVGQLLYLQSEDATKDINLYIDSPGGNIYAGLAIYDTMQWLTPDISTVCMGRAMGMGAVLLAAGAVGKRFALPASKIGLVPVLSGAEGQTADIEITAREILRLRRSLMEILAHHTGQSSERIMLDMDKTLFLSANDAISYGIVDDVLYPIKS